MVIDLRNLCIVCLRAHVSYVATCSLAHVSCALTCSRANVPCVLTCSRANVSCVLSFSRANVSCVLICSRANFSRVSTSLHALTSNNKKNFSMTYPYIWNKTAYKKCLSRKFSRDIYFENSVVHSCIFSYQTEAFNRCYDKLFIIKMEK